jgi:hypothetical protein
MTSPPLPSRHRLARLLLWARLWLVGLGGVIVQLIALDPKRADHVTRYAARVARDLVIFHALHRVRRPRLKRGPKPLGKRRAGGVRAFIGVRLRQRLATRDPVARFFAVLALLRDFDVEVSRFARRMRRGMTRLYARRYPWTNVALNTPPASATLCANTS